MSHVTRAFAAVKAAGESLRNAEFHLGMVPGHGYVYDETSARVHLEDVRIALGHAAMALADMHADEPKPPTYMRPHVPVEHER